MFAIFLWISMNAVCTICLPTLDLYHRNHKQAKDIYCVFKSKTDASENRFGRVKLTEKSLANWIIFFLYKEAI